LAEAVRIALQIVEESAVLADRTGRDARVAGRHNSAATYEAKAKELRQHEDVLRRSASRET
jgi:hypothetical protein